MRTDQFDYHLPPELIAQTPAPRGESRLMVLHRADGKIEHRQFGDLLEYLRPGDLLVHNDTRVTARRMTGIRESGQEAEVLLLRKVGERGWEAMVRSGRSLRPGKTLTVVGDNRITQMVTATVVETTAEGGKILEFESEAVRDSLATWGVSPLPPYIYTPLPAAEEERYQTVYARQDGSAAAPTAGLHFTRELLDKATAHGVERTYVTLQVGIDTFRPSAENIAEHQMHGEWIEMSPEAADRINAARGRVIAVGTTSTRTLEAAAAQRSPADREAGLRVVPYRGETELFITPGYAFQATDVLITNFHLPRSSLLMLVSALAGMEQTRFAYQEAVRLGYRFFSFGDAMLIV